VAEHLDILLLDLLTVEGLWGKAIEVVLAHSMVAVVAVEQVLSVATATVQTVVLAELV
jgi:hypothetical protein